MIFFGVALLVLGAVMVYIATRPLPKAERWIRCQECSGNGFIHPDDGAVCGVCNGERGWWA